MAIRGKVVCTKRTSEPVYSYDPETKQSHSAEIVPQTDPAFKDEMPEECRRYFEFAGVVKTDDPKSENRVFAKASFQFEIKLAVSNAAVDFEPGREYYVDFAKAPR